MKIEIFARTLYRDKNNTRYKIIPIAEILYFLEVYRGGNLIWEFWNRKSLVGVELVERGPERKPVPMKVELVDCCRSKSVWRILHSTWNRYARPFVISSTRCVTRSVPRGTRTRGSSCDCWGARIWKRFWRPTTRSSRGRKRHHRSRNHRYWRCPLTRGWKPSESSASEGNLMNPWWEFMSNVKRECSKIFHKDKVLGKIFEHFFERWVCKFLNWIPQKLGIFGG